MDAIAPPTLDISAGDTALDRTVRLALARQALLESPPPSRRAFVGRKPRGKYLKVRPRLMAALERVAEKGSDRHVWLVLDAVALLTVRGQSDAGAAETIVDGLRADASLYDDADDWSAVAQQAQIAPVWIVAMVGFGLVPIFVWVRTGLDVVYLLALLGGGLGCFLDWNRSEARNLSSTYFQRLTLRAFQPFTSAIYGLLTVLLLRSGIVNLKPANVSEPTYLFLAAVLAGYGSDTMQRLSKAFGRRE